MVVRCWMFVEAKCQKFEGKTDIGFERIRFVARGKRKFPYLAEFFNIFHHSLTKWHFITVFRVVCKVSLVIVLGVHFYVKYPLFLQPLVIKFYSITLEGEWCRTICNVMQWGTSWNHVKLIRDFMSARQKFPVCRYGVEGLGIECSYVKFSKELNFGSSNFPEKLDLSELLNLEVFWIIAFRGLKNELLNFEKGEFSTKKICWIENFSENSQL